MKKSLLFLSVLISIPIFSQVGINTDNPRQLFHIDGKYSTQTVNPSEGEPSEMEQIDDVVITNSGRVGIGTNTPKGALEINSINSGFVLPRLTDVQRDKIPLGSRPTGTVIYNINSGRIQVNSGTDDIPIWGNLETTSTSINTLSFYEKKIEQTIASRAITSLTFSTDAVFSNSPNGFITRPDLTTFRLKKGKVYKLEFSMGSIVGSEASSVSCSFFNKTEKNDISHGRAYPTTFNAGPGINVSGKESIVNYIEPQTDIDIDIRCYPVSGGTKTWWKDNDFGSYSNPPASLTIQILN